MNARERLRESRKSPNPGGYHARGMQPPVVIDPNKLPDHPCPNCGARGWCGHNGRTPT